VWFTLQLKISKNDYRSIFGLSLIELMVATAIGLMMTVLVINYLSANLQTRNMNAGYNRMKDGGALSLYFLANHTRDAGLKTLPIYGDATKTNGECNPVADNCTNDTDSAFDRLVVRKIYPEDTIACNGEALAENVEVLEVISVDVSTDGNFLVCQSYSLTANDWLGGTDAKRVLQAGIDGFQVQYYEKGLAQPVNGRSVTNWGNVAGVEVMVLANSQTPAFLKVRASRFKLLDSTELPFNDRLARQIFQTTIAFNNQLLNE